MEVSLSVPAAADAEEFISAVQASRSLHHPWVEPPDSAARYAAYLNHAARDDQAAFLLRHGSCGELVGYVNLNNIVHRSFQSAHLGYAAFASHAGRGLMSAGLSAVLDRVFSEMRLHRVEANIQPTNAPSIKLVRRLGFQKEGFSRAYLLVDGEWRDHERWALLRDQWRK
ncbi:MAG: GNAT family N-acetyltransferase [Acidimicrobiales bacterium]